jgi:hypothetical protein
MALPRSIQLNRRAVEYIRIRRAKIGRPIASLLRSLSFLAVSSKSIFRSGGELGAQAL